MRVGVTRACDVLAEAAAGLRQAGVPEPEASAQVLLSELLGVRRGEIAFRKEPLSERQTSQYGAVISRRKNREPVQRILGYAYFRNLKLSLSDETLIPRPDTESVVDAVLQRIDARSEPSFRILDIGTGTGAIAISVVQERPSCDVHASDISEIALQTARRNAAENRADVTFYRSDLANGLRELDHGVNLLVSNPPYIERDTLAKLEPEVREHDPSLALDGGTDGLDFYRRIFDETKYLLKPCADVVLEVGDRQAEDVMRLGELAGFDLNGAYEDLTGKVRAVMLRWPG